MQSVPLGNDQNSELSLVTKTVPLGNNQIHIILTESDFPKTEVSELDQDNEIDKNQIIEQGLIEEMNLSTERQSLIDSAIDNTSTTEINISCDISENKGSSQHLSYLFKTAIKSRQQEILNWYCYSLEFENRVHSIATDGKIKDKIARTMIYKEMKPFLPNISQDNLQKKLLELENFLCYSGKRELG
ncbi:hypothetical protein Glove_284g66 [Diversispora epigaea]|uniref:Uncharacterized protein n=1 Tax=Diversispora epigaea TaxID=1348612 RepID=A0A397I693_9GLOM|nr:hypothetical protein Glove_284g66 [Diversispora epigaea]